MKNIPDINTAWDVAKEKYGLIDLQDVRIEIYLHGGDEALRKFDIDFAKRDSAVIRVQGQLSSGRKVNSALDNPASFFAGKGFIHSFSKDGPR